MLKDKEGAALMFEFIISLACLALGGWLIFSGKGSEIGGMVITAVITFWFSRRQSEAATKQAETIIKSTQPNNDQQNKGDGTNV